MYTFSEQENHPHSRTEILDKASMDLLSIPPLVFRTLRRRIARTGFSVADVHLTPLHFEILRLLSEEGTLHASEIGDRLQIAKAQLTKLIDRLVVLNIVERKINSSDRRTYKITLTPHASAILSKHENRAIEAVRDIMSSLSDRELENLSLVLRGLRDLLFESADAGFPRPDIAADPTLSRKG